MHTAAEVQFHIPALEQKVHLKDIQVRTPGTSALRVIYKPSLQHPFSQRQDTEAEPFTNEF